MLSSVKKLLLALGLLAALALTIAPTAAFASTKPDHYYCTPGWVYDSISNAGVDYYGLGPEFAQYNPYSYTITANWSVTVNGSVSVSASAGGSFDLSAIVAGVQFNLNAQVQFTVGVSGTEGVFVPVQPHQWVYGRFSIERQKAYGHLYYLTSYCGIGTNYGTVESWSPWRTTWDLW